MRLFEELAVAAGTPKAIWGPALAAYRLPRPVKVDGLAGPSESPTRGLAPGCPGATDWLASLVFLWEFRIAAISHLADGRDYIDDTVACATEDAELLRRGLPGATLALASSGRSQSPSEMPPSSC